VKERFVKLNVPSGAAVVVFVLTPFIYKYNVADAVVVPLNVVAAGVYIPFEGEVITGTVTEPANAFGPLPAAQK